MTFKRFLDVVRDPVETTEAARVDCPTCPVNMACIVGQDGTGWTFNCCRSTGVVVEGEVVVIDCAKHNFAQNERAKAYKKCPLCSGDVMEVVERARRAGTAPTVYLPTVHAKVSIAERQVRWQASHERALRRLADEDEAGKRS